jgi:hypothetical protein
MHVAALIDVCSESFAAGFCPLLARKRTNSSVIGLSAKCQEATYAPQQKHRYSITSSASLATGTAVQV